MTAPTPRPAARVILLDPANRLLLFRFGRRWVTPGGGLDPGETHEEAAVRELAEECGITGAELGPEIWRREVEFDWKGRRLLQQERYFVTRVLPFEVSTAGWTADEVEVIGEHRWWPLAEIPDEDDAFAPRRLGSLVRRFLREGPPAEPIDTGI